MDQHIPEKGPDERQELRKESKRYKKPVPGVPDAFTFDAKLRATDLEGKQLRVNPYGWVKDSAAKVFKAKDKASEIENLCNIRHLLSEEKELGPELIKSVKEFRELGPRGQNKNKHVKEFLTRLEAIAGEYL